jgi:anti-anti-sigma factor
MAIRSEEVNAVALVRFLSSHLDASNSTRLRTQLLDEVRATRRILLDVSQIRYVDAMGLELLLDAVRECPGGVEFCGVGAELGDLLRLSQLQHTLTLWPDVESALAEGVTKPSSAMVDSVGGR